MKAFRILHRSLLNALRSIFRNLSLSIASISCIIITLIIVSISLLLSGNINKFTTDIENDLTIIVYTKENISSEDISKIDDDLKRIPNIDKINFTDRNKIKENVEKEDESFNKIMSDWSEDENPLPDIYTITVKDSELISETAETIKNLEYIDSVEYGEGMVEQLISLFNTVKKLTVIAVIALVFVTAFLISNTIKITIYSRRNEIDIMRLVGTSNTVIKLPFIFEGLFLGILGSFIPIVFTIYGYVFLYDKVGGKFFTDFIELVSPYNFVLKISLILLAIGASVGMYGSYKAVRKYLKI